MSVKGNVQYGGFFRRLCLLVCGLVLMSGICASTAQAEVAAAGDLLVNLDSTTLTVGELSSWTNAGTLGGTFGTSTKNPVVESVLGVSAVTFADNAWLKSDFLATADFTGDSDWSVELWALNPSIGGDEGMLTWSNRGEENRNAACCYSTASGWGAFAGWGAGDIGYANAIAPAAGIWHHITFTYAGGANGALTVYVDGKQNNQATKNLAIHGPADNQAMPVILGGSTGGDATGLAANGSEQWFTGSISKVRIHGGLLTAEQVQGNYDAEKASYLSSLLAISKPSPASLDFGVIAPEAGQSPAQTVVIKNNGTGDLTFNTPSVSLTGAASDQFKVLDFDATPLAPGASRSVEVVCDTTTVGLLKAQLAFNTDSPVTPSVTLLAMGSKPEALTAAGDLLVNLNAKDLTADTTQTWPNTGTLGGEFINPAGDKYPNVESVQGVKAVKFADQKWLKSNFLTTAAFTGNSDWSLETWVYDPSVGYEEQVVMWSNRGEDSKNAAFIYGTAPNWGAFGGWGNGDLGFLNAAPPAQGTWHHVAITYAGGANSPLSVYVDGQFNNSRTMNLAIHGPADNEAMPVFLGGSTGDAADGLNANATGWWFSGALAAVRFHDGALTADQVYSNYSFESGDYDFSALAVNVNPANRGDVVLAPAGNVYENGTTVTLTATPREGYRFLNWTGDVTSTETVVTVTMTANKTVTANFEALPTYVLALVANPIEGGVLAVSPEQTSYTLGTTVTVTATANTYFGFTGWTGNVPEGLELTNPLTLVMDADTTIGANFIADSTPPAGTVAPVDGNPTSGTQVAFDVVFGEDVFGFTDASTGSLVVNLSGTITYAGVSVAETVEDNQSSATSVISKRHYVVQVSGLAGNGFVSLEINPSACVDIAGNGNVKIGPSTAVLVDQVAPETMAAPVSAETVSLDAEVQFTWAAAVDPDPSSGVAGYLVQIGTAAGASDLFDGAVTSSTLEKTLVCPLGATVYSRVCAFDQVGNIGAWSDSSEGVLVQGPANEYALTVAVVGEGSVTKSPDQATYVAGTTVTLTATAADGYHFTGWSGATTSTVNPLVVTMDSAKALTATFEQDVVVDGYALTVAVVGEGSVTKSPDQVSYAAGTTVTLTATPAVGYSFTGWSGATTSTQNPLDVVMDSTKTLTATFAANEYALVVEAVNGSVTKSPDQAAYAHGTTVTLMATPAAGYQFAGWSGATTSTLNPLDVVMDSTKTLTANFEVVVLPAPAELTASGNTFRVLLNWSPVTSATAYLIERTVAGTTDTAAISWTVSAAAALTGSATTNAFADDTASPAVSYAYTVKAVDVLGNPGLASNVATAAVTAEVLVAANYKVTAKGYALVRDAANNLTFTPTIADSNPGTIKITLLKKMPGNAVDNAGKGIYYLTSVTQVPVLRVEGSVKTLSFDVPVLALSVRDLAKSVSAKSVTFLTANEFGSISIKATKPSEDGVYARTFIETTSAGTTPMSIKVTGAVVEEVGSTNATPQPIKLINVASKTYKDASKAKRTSLGAIGSLPKVVNELQVGNTTSAPAEATPSSIQGSTLKAITVSGGPLVADELVGAIDKVTVAGGNLRCGLIQSSKDLVLIQATAKKINGALVGGAVGTAGSATAMVVKAQPAANSKRVAITKVYGQAGVSGYFYAGYDAETGAPTQTGGINILQTKSGVVEGAAFLDPTLVSKMKVLPKTPVQPIVINPQMQ